MRSNPLRRTVALGLSSLVIIAGLSFAPAGIAFAEDGVDWTSVQPDEQEPGAEVGVETDGTAGDGAEELPAGPTTEVGVEPDLEAEAEFAPRMLQQTLSLESPVAALASGTFDPGNIISDYNFFNSSAMTEAEIQRFLDDTIAAPCENSNCLNVLKMNTPNASWSWGNCSPYSGAANESAARIIYKVQRACGLSAKVILVTLQKEQSLITRNGPSESILRKAMGMGCPDTDVCDSQYYGFFNQVYAAARQIVWYTNPESSMFKSKKYEVGQVKPVQVHPNAACGAPNVRIGNIATAALYWYTPYQPNAAALAAGWGASADPCSSYGNRNFSLYYNKWFGDPTSASVSTVRRVAGADRYDTAVEISKLGFSGDKAAPVVYIASGEGFSDALSAGPAAAAQGGPLLLVGANFVTQSTLDELKRLKPAKIVIAGGRPSVSTDVERTLATFAPVTRLAGSDRFETSRLIANYAFAGFKSAYIATGVNFPDALAAGAAAGAQRIPVLLVDGRLGEPDAGITALLKKNGVKSVKIAGDFPSVSKGLGDSLKGQGIAVTRFAGWDRYDTSWMIAKDAFPTSKSAAFVATGINFPDALAGAAAAALSGSPLFVTPPTCVRPEVREHLTAAAVTRINLLGGTPSLNESVAKLGLC